MYCKLITKNDCAVKAVLSCTPVEFLIINKAIARCSNDEFYTEPDRRTMVLMGEAMKNFEQVEVADTPQTDKDKVVCPNCGRSDYIRSFEKDFNIKNSVYRYKCINCNTYIKDAPQTEVSKEEFVEGMKNLRMEVKQTDCSWK